MTETGEQLGQRILAMHDIETEVVTVDEWDNTKIEVRSMTGKERASMLDVAVGDDGEIDFEAMFPFIIASCSFHPDTGEKLWSTQDINALNGKNAKALQRVAEVGMRLSGLDKETEEKRAESFRVRDK